MVTLMLSKEMRESFTLTQTDTRHLQTKLERVLQTPWSPQIRDGNARGADRDSGNFDSKPARTHPLGFMRKIGIEPELIEQADKNILADHNFTHAELSFALHNIDTNKATGLDRIAPIFIKALRNNMIFREILLRIFNKILDTGHVPRQWKLDRRILLEKKGDNTDAMNYRPIAVHSIFRKILCSIIERRERHMTYFDATPYGFMPGKRLRPCSITK